MTPAPPYFPPPSLWLLTPSFLLDKRLLAPHSTVQTLARIHTHTHPLQHIHAGQDGVFVLFSQTAWEEGKGREG